MKKRADGRYQQQLPLSMTNGKRVVLYGKTKSELLRKLADYEEKAENGLSFEAVADAWWEDAEPALAVTTRRAYRPAMRRAIQAMGEEYIKEISPQEINTFLKKIIKQNSMADKTARTQLMVVNLIMRYAVEEGYIESNPARDLSVPKGLSKERREIASEADIKLVKESYDAPFGDFAYWALYTGCRRGELIALTWDDVDIEKRTITISKSMFRDEDGKMKPKSTKTVSGNRIVPILDKLMEKLTPGKGYVFGNPDGTPYTDRQVMRGWERYQKATGVTCTPHQLRHAYATMLFEAGVSESDAQTLLGHAQISTTKDIYTHIRETRAQKIRSQILSIDIE